MPEYSYACDECNHKWSIFCHRSEYRDKKKCPSCKKIKSVHRDYEEDNVYGAYNFSVSEAKTLGHYADKQSKKYGKWKCEDMKRDFKTKKVQGGAELPDGMSRMQKSDGGVKWTKDEPKKKRRKKNR
jgi:putative FmdB family regulatory protein